MNIKHCLRPAGLDDNTLILYYYYSINYDVFKHKATTELDGTVVFLFNVFLMGWEFWDA